jgi:hypothetical protein
VVLATGIALTATAQQPQWSPEIPKTWDEAALKDWATPLAGLNVRPTHMSSKEYYSVPEYSLRSYPVYMPAREPASYWDMLQHVEPKPLIEGEKLKTEADWIKALGPYRERCRAFDFDLRRLSHAAPLGRRPHSGRVFTH